MPIRNSPAIQDYVKALYALEWEQHGEDGTGARAQISTTGVAGRLGVSAASATNMLKKLDSMGLISYVPYKGAALSEAGRRVALEVIRHHRLLETYLAEAMGVPWDRVHDEAEVLEHVLSEDLEDRISSLLGHPTADPHGHPIPAKDGSMPASSQRRLWEVPDGEVIAIERVSDNESEGLRYLAEVGIIPGTMVEVVKRGPVGGPLFVRTARGEIEPLSKEIAEAVWVA